MERNDIYGVPHDVGWHRARLKAAGQSVKF